MLASRYAEVLELADRLDSGSSSDFRVRVQVPSSALYILSHYLRNLIRFLFFVIRIKRETFFDFLSLIIYEFCVNSE